MTTATRKCAYCKERFRTESGIVRGLNAWCSEDHQIQWAIKAGKELKNREFKARKKSFDAGDKPLQLRLTQEAFNRMIRLLDKSKGCISCDRPASWQGQWHASHYKSVGSHPMLRFDARNVHRSCSVCNARLSGNLVAYRDNLVIEYGKELVDFLEGPHEPKKYTCEELITMRREFGAECRLLESGKPPSRDWRALG